MRSLDGKDHEDAEGRPRLLLGLLAAAMVFGIGAVGWLFLARTTTVPKAPAANEKRRPASGEARATPAPRPESGSVEVASNVPGALVAIDGRQLGPAPQRAELRSGPHQLSVLKNGYQAYEREVLVLPGRSVRVEARLEAEAPRLRVDADVPGASVFLDRKPVGRTPFEGRDLAPGTHRLNVTAEGYDMYSETIELLPGTREVMVRFKEVRLDETLAVTHKHAIGSCAGNLVASGAGLRYQTSDPKDAFEAQLTALEPLQADFLRKNLRVRMKGGRTYNFTAASAEALLSFQKAVEAARKRMQSQGPA